MARWHKPEPPATEPPLAELVAEPKLPLTLSQVREKLQTLDQMMQQAETDREWDNLSRAYERIFKVWCYLAGLPGPGNRRPAPERRQPSQVQPEPVPIVPQQDKASS